MRRRSGGSGAFGGKGVLCVATGGNGVFCVARDGAFGVTTNLTRRFSVFFLGCFGGSGMCKIGFGC